MFRDLMTLQDRMNRLFDELAPRRRGEEEVFYPTSWHALGREQWVPDVDICETDNAIEIDADLPDMKPEDVDIRIEGNMLHLKGERKLEKENHQGNFYRMERSYGSFSRSFALPTNVDPNKVEANYKDGVLHITLPKREEARPKQIKINASQHGQSHKITATEKK